MRSKNQYRFPFEDEILTLAVSYPQTHYSDWKHAVDFLLGCSTTILAARAGKVIDVKDDSNEGGLEEKFKQDIKFQNYITIEHDNGEYSQYVHISHNGLLVKEGDIVKEGQPIAKGIGMIGFTSALHLHFMVFRGDDNKEGYESLEVRWKKPLTVFNNEQKVAEEIQKPKYKRLLEELSESPKTPL